MKKKIVIFGITELAQLAHFYFSHDSEFEVVAFTLDRDYIVSQNYLGLPIVPFDLVQEKYPIEDFYMYVAIGYTKLNEHRRNKYLEAKSKGYRLASYVCSKSTSWPGLIIGENSFIMEDNTIMPFCEIGNNVLICVNNIVAHHMIIKDHVTITSHCAIGGHVVIGEQAFIGLNSTLRNNITIGKGAVIGTAANVVANVNEYAVMLGNPAKASIKDARDINL
jgi:sugar O-acyltransferase (sialic acid O-acetyltransferase NeuD family)